MSSLAPYFIRVEDATDLDAAIIYIMLALGVSVGGIVAGHIIKR